MNNKFDLERFKAGEPAIHEDYDIYYVGTLPNGQIVFSWNYGTGWNVQNWDLSAFKNTTMQPREEFIVVDKNWKGGMSFEKAEQERMRLGEDYITVKIVR